MFHSFLYGGSRLKSCKRVISYQPESLLIKGTLLLGNDSGTYGITGDIDSGTQHIQDTVDTHDQCNAFGSSPTEVSTMDRVTRPTLGTPAVPMEAIVAVAMTVAMAAGVRGIP